MAAANSRYWRVVGNFHTVGEVIVWVTAPNWVGAIRKGALALKREPKMKGRRLTVGAFTVQEVDSLPISQLAEQLPLTSNAQSQGGQQESPEQAVPSSPEVEKG
jgi:hypothetical protein